VYETVCTVITHDCTMLLLAIDYAAYFGLYYESCDMILMHTEQVPQNDSAF